MAIEIVTNGTIAAMYDNTTDVAFGPVCGECECGADGEQMLLAFIDWSSENGWSDVRKYSDLELHKMWGEFCRADHDHEEKRSG